VLVLDDDDDDDDDDGWEKWLMITSELLEEEMTFGIVLISFFSE